MRIWTATGMLHLTKKAIKLWQCIMNRYQHKYCLGGYLKNWSCLIRDVTLRNVSCNLVRIHLQIASFNWLHDRNIARQVARGMLHCVEPDYTSCNASCNENVAWLYDCKFACNLCRNKMARQAARWNSALFHTGNKHIVIFRGLIHIVKIRQQIMHGNINIRRSFRAIPNTKTRTSRLLENFHIPKMIWIHFCVTSHAQIFSAGGG